MKKVLATVLALVMALALCTTSWADEGTITLDDFLKALNVTESTTSVTFDGASHANAVNGKLTVKWSPVSGCFDNRDNHSCTVNNVKATGNTPNRVNSNNAQYQILSTVKDVTIKNVNFVFVPSDFTICANSDWAGTFTSSSAPNAQLYLLNSGNTTVEGCSFDRVVFTGWQNTGATVVKNCAFKNTYNSYAVKDLGGASAEVTGCTFENCSGAIMTDTSSDRSVETKKLTISNNSFTNIDVAGTAPQEKVGTRGIIQIAAATKVTGETSITLDSNTAENCGPVLRQLNESVDMSKTSGDLSGLVNANGKLTATDDSKSAAGESGSKEIEVPYTPTPEKPSNNYYYYYPTTTTTDTTKGSPKTFDAGIALYVGMALTSVTGLAYTGKKRED